MDTPNTQGNTQSQAKLAAALASFLFFVPLLMDVRTPFVVKYMKQGFILNVASIVLSIVLSFVWMNGFG
jgi:hypothetical protein